MKRNRNLSLDLEFSLNALFLDKRDVLQDQFDLGCDNIEQTLSDYAWYCLFDNLQWHLNDTLKYELKHATV